MTANITLSVISSITTGTCPFDTVHEPGIFQCVRCSTHLFRSSNQVSQRFAILATQSEGQPYGNLIAFAEADKLSSLLFVTSRNTRKYSNILASKKVAVLIDSITNQALDLNNAIAITALGNIEEANTANEEYLSGIYLAKHPQLRDFLHKPSNALMKVSVTDYVVATFESVRHFPVRQQE